MDLGLEGKTALVVGGSKGIGKGIAFGLAREGVDLAICARGKEELEKTAGEISAATGRRVLPVQADMSVHAEIQRLVATAVASLGRIDMLVYSANIPGGGNFAGITDEAWRVHIEIKLLGCIRCTREVIPHMQKNNWGRVVIISGMSARILRPSSVDNGPICAALSNFGKQVSNEVAPHGIRVNTIHPASTLTPRLERLNQRMAREQGITVEEAWQQRLQKIPIGRLIKPEEIANLAVFLCSEAADAITGQSIAVDGGIGTGIFY